MKILLVADDPHLEAEVQSAISGSGDVAPVLQRVSEQRKAAETARNLEHDFVLIELTDDLRRFKETVREVSTASPQSIVAAIFDPQAADADRSEGTLLIEAFRTGIQDILRRPLSSADLAQLLARGNRSAKPITSRPAGLVTSFISNKGGVGKSTMSVNTACGLAQKHPNNVLLIDAALQMGVCASMLDLRPTATITDAIRERDRLDETLLRQLVTQHESGLHLLAAPANAVEAVDVDDEAIAQLLNLARRTYRYVIVDTFPLLDSVVVAILDLTDRLYLVVENVVPTLIGARSLIHVLRDLGFPLDRQRLVLNRFSTAGGGPKPIDVEEELGTEVSHVVPYHKQAIVAANTGEPFILKPRLFGPGRATRQIVDEINSLGHSNNGTNGAARGRHG